MVQQKYSVCTGYGSTEVLSLYKIWFNRSTQSVQDMARQKYSVCTGYGSTEVLSLYRTAPEKLQKYITKTGKT